jgi:pyruvate dehydrogenase E2 component (dihydrolipoamide acetyltransferase)
MTKSVKLPELGEEVESAEVVNVLVRVGDTISAQQDILEIETDKASVSVPSDSAGTVKEIHVKAGDTIKPGAMLLTLEE